MRFTSIHHVALWVSDLPKAKEFYVQKLGFTLLRESVRATRGDVKLDLRHGEIELELFCAPGHPARLSYPEALGLRHVAFRVSDIDAAVSELLSMGIVSEPVRIDEYTGQRMTFFFDPDGQPLELHE